MSPAWSGRFSDTRITEAVLTALPGARAACAAEPAPLTRQGCFRKAPFPLCPAGFTVYRAGTMEGSRLRGECGQGSGQRGLRREISHGRSDSEGSESSVGLAGCDTCVDPRFHSPHCCHHQQESCQEGTVPWGRAGSAPARLSPSLRSGRWDAQAGCLCASVALSKSKVPPAGWGTAARI